MRLEINPEKFFASYSSMMHSEVSDDIRASLWDQCREYFPQITDLVYEQYKDSAQIQDHRQLDRTTGATFLFLALVNALLPEPIVELENMEFTCLEEEEEDLSPVKTSFPSFGYLKALS